MRYAVAVIKDYPCGVSNILLHMQRPYPLLAQLIYYIFRYRLDLGRGLAAGYDEIIADRRHLPHIDDDDIVRLLLAGGIGYRQDPDFSIYRFSPFEKLNISITSRS